MKQAIVRGRSLRRQEETPFPYVPSTLESV